MQAFGKLTIVSLAAALLAAPLVGDAIAANEKTNKRFCNRYAESMASIVSQAMKQNSACLDADRGVHPSAEHHFGWCMQNTRSTVSGAAQNISVLVKKCTGSASGASNPANREAKTGGKRFC